MLRRLDCRLLKAGTTISNHNLCSATIHRSSQTAGAVRNLLASQNGHILFIVFVIALSSLFLAFLTAAASSKCSSATALRIALAHTSLISESNVPRNFSLSNIMLNWLVGIVVKSGGGRERHAARSVYLWENGCFPSVFSFVLSFSTSCLIMWARHFIDCIGRAS